MTEADNLPILHPDFAKRLQAAMAAKGLNATDIARALSTTPEMGRRYRNGQAMPRMDRLRELARVLEVDLAYLAYGTSSSTPRLAEHLALALRNVAVHNPEMFKKYSKDMGLSEQAVIELLAARLVREAQPDYNNELAKSHISDMAQPTIIQVKSFAQIINNEQGIDTMMVFGEFPKSVFGYRLDTDQMQGMRGEYIRTGSMLTIDPDATPSQGDVVLAEMGGDPIIGHYVRHAGAVKVRPSNEQYEVTDITNGRILGVVRQWAYAPPQ